VEISHFFTRCSFPINTCRACAYKLVLVIRFIWLYLTVEKALRIHHGLLRVGRVEEKQRLEEVWLHHLIGKTGQSGARRQLLAGGGRGQDGGEQGVLGQLLTASPERKEL
jgi:hypothetical protein